MNKIFIQNLIEIHFLKMFAALVALCISADVVTGGWQTISVDSEQVKAVRNYLDRNVPHLFPETQNGGYSICQNASCCRNELTINY